jgi:hypothetical protein
MAAEQDAARDLISHGSHCRSQSGLIAVGAAARRRPVGTRLAKRKIAAENGEAGTAKGVGEGSEQRRLAVRTGAVGQHQAVATGSNGAMQEASHGCVFG